MPNLDLPSVATQDQETHISDHNKVRQALIDINTAVDDVAYCRAIRPAVTFTPCR